VRVAVVPGAGQAGLLCPLADDGTMLDSPALEPDLAAAMASRERAGQVRWVLRSAAHVYPVLLRSGVRLTR